MGFSSRMYRSEVALLPTTYALRQTTREATTVATVANAPGRVGEKIQYHYSVIAVVADTASE